MLWWEKKSFCVFICISDLVQGTVRDLQILESLSLQYNFQCSSACRNYTAATYGLEQSSFLNITLTSCKIFYYVYFFPCRKTLFPDREPSIWTGTQTSNLKVTSWLLWPLQVAHLLFLTQDAKNPPERKLPNFLASDFLKSTQLQKSKFFNNNKDLRLGFLIWGRVFLVLASVKLHLTILA